MPKRFDDILSPVTKYWIFLIGIVAAIFSVIFGSFFASYLNLTTKDQLLAKELFEKLIAFPFLGALLLVLIISTLVSLIFRHYIIPVLKMAEQTRLITSVNPTHRIVINGARELHQLAEVINESADAYQNLQSEIEEKIQAKNLALKQERNRFAALMSELPSGVVVCNTDGTILLYNRKAQDLLNQDQKVHELDLSIGGTIGLGRSIFGVLDREPIVHTLEVMSHSQIHGQVKPALGLMTTLCNQRFIRVNMAPITGQEKEDRRISGFVLTLEDITGEIEADNERDRQLQALIDAVQNSLGRIHSGIAEICQMPGIGGEVCEHHRAAINQVTDDLQKHLALARELYSQHHRATGGRENVFAATLFSILAKNLHERFGLEIETQVHQNCWLSIDSYRIIQSFANLAGLLKSEHRIGRLKIELREIRNQFALINLSWSGQDIPAETIQDWLAAPLFMDTDGKSESPNAIIAKHGGTVLMDESSESGYQDIDLSLPVALTEEGETLTTLIEPRPISYEFDLFHQPGQQTLGNISLRKLTYVAFDTETTGLNPSDGDEIIQIGAVRIVNGRIQPNEVVDQLVNPRRVVPQSSVKVHGITPELLKNQPTIDTVLPHFHSFAKGSVLVAHNAAFDMRFLQLKEIVTGLRFDNPVLDTLLLSTIIHPHQENHSLDAIAQLMNIKIVGRHTALGDSLVTAEVLLKLIPLLEVRGIYTLADALEASAQSPLVKLKY